MNRKPQRTREEVIGDVKRTKQLLREDVLAIIQSAKTKQEAIESLTDFVKEIPDKAIAYQNSREMGLNRLVSDLDSYGLWQK